MSVKPMIQFKKEFNLRKFFRGTKIFPKSNSYCTIVWDSLIYILLILHYSVLALCVFLTHTWGSSACWGERTWEKWRKLSLAINQSFYVNCEDSLSLDDGNSSLKSHSSYTGEGQLSTL